MSEVESTGAADSEKIIQTLTKTSTSGSVQNVEEQVKTSAAIREQTPTLSSVHKIESRLVGIDKDLDILKAFKAEFTFGRLIGSLVAVGVACWVLFVFIDGKFDTFSGERNNRLESMDSRISELAKKVNENEKNVLRLNYETKAQDYEVK